MKTKILFVDDEDMVLQGLRRMLRPMREEWEMEFVESGAGALELMAKTSFDLIVSDMRMPGMNGAELLTEVMQRHPKTVRFILSGHADADLVFHSAGAAHQFLAKPCDADTLKTTVMRATKLEAMLQSERLQELVARIDRLPSAPSLYLELVEVMKHPGTGIEEIDAIISKDMAITAMILKLVNSAFFGLRREVCSTLDAARFLGVETIRWLVLAANTFSQFEDEDIEGFSVETLWLHSLETSTGSKAIAQMEGSIQKQLDEAYVAGLLHDVGKLVLATNFKKEFEESIRLKNTLGIEDWLAEQQIFGVNHADIGGSLLGLWGLPMPVIEAISLHHTPSRSKQVEFSALTSVHAADAILRHPLAGPNPYLDMNYLAALNLGEKPEKWRTSIRSTEG